MLKEIKFHLTPNGTFLMYDLVRENNESRDDYNDRILKAVKEYCHKYSKKEYHLLEQHFLNDDFPETCETLKSIGEKAGFAKIKSLFQDKKHFIIRSFAGRCFQVVSKSE